MKLVWATILLAPATSGLAGALVVPEPTRRAMAEHQLAQQSGLPETTLQRRLNHCNGDQQTMYFCVWRDLLVVKAVLERRLAARNHAGSTFPMLSVASLSDWRKSRDAACTKSAATDYAGGGQKGADG